VRRRISQPEVRLDLDDARGAPAGRAIVDEDFSEKVARDVRCRASVEGTREAATERP
jgi:hypothetical protein